MEFHENTATRISLLPASISLNGIAVFGDGGTMSLESELSDSTELRINLPPVRCVLYPNRKPQLYLQIYYPYDRAPESHSVAVRSELESQLVSLLKNCSIEYRLTRLHIRARQHYGYPVEAICEEETIRYNDDIRRARDTIVAFVASEEYVKLNATQEVGCRSSLSNTLRVN